jgi:hypothetical protein
LWRRALSITRYHGLEEKPRRVGVFEFLHNAYETFICKEYLQGWSEPKISKNLVLVITEETIKAKVFLLRIKRGGTLPKAIDKRATILSIENS